MTSNSTPRHIPKRNENIVFICDGVITGMPIVALFTLAKGWKQPGCPSTGQWISKQWNIHITEYCLAIKRSELLRDARTWTSLETIMLGERSQKQKAAYCMVPFI